ncbi:unnamed protein product [Rotaria sp. Silwood2]|nr:unnamed protein product [Rotaria sp. Silwood2]
MGYIGVSNYETTNKNRWQSIRILKNRQSSVKFLPIEMNSNIYEAFISPTDPYIAPDIAKNGPYSLGDLFLEESSGSGYYIIQGRVDDVLVHTTGEKTNPLPIELAIQEHPIIKRAVVVGHQRFCCSVLIELNLEEAFQYELRSIEEQVFTAVQSANKDAPTHSRIIPALIKILPMSKHLPITGKGNIIRKLVDQEYGSIIDQMYNQFLKESQNKNNSQLHLKHHLSTKHGICIYLQRIVAEIFNKPIEIFADYSKSLYSLSLDSLTAIELRNILCVEFGQLDQQIIHEFSSIDALADQLLRIINKEQVQTSIDTQHYKETEEIIDKYIDLMKIDDNRRIITSKKHSNDCDHNIQNERIFLITGANGSLGSQILLQLLQKLQVSRIYCFVRGQDASDRLRRAMEIREQDLTMLLNNNRIIILNMDLNHDRLGQTQDMYKQLQNEVTDIIHSAWKMDFNMTIKDFDQDCLQGLYRLLKFASSSTTKLPKRFHFISSISAAGSNLFNEIKEEPLPRRVEIALPHGYGQSKYAAEHICLAAMDLWKSLPLVFLGVPIDIYRFGQISGDSGTGAWNTAEMISLMICAGGGGMGILPDKCQKIDWIPANYGAACVVDIAINTSTELTSPFERVHHILNPHEINWSELLEHLKLSGLQFKVVSIKEWLRMLLASPKNPAYALVSFFEKLFADDNQMEFAKFRTEKTTRRTTMLECCPPIDQKLIQRYLNYWWKIGFLKYGYNPNI